MTNQRVIQVAMINALSQWVQDDFCMAFQILILLKANMDLRP